MLSPVRLRLESLSCRRGGVPTRRRPRRHAAAGYFRLRRPGASRIDHTSAGHEQYSASKALRYYDDGSSNACEISAVGFESLQLSMIS